MEETQFFASPSASNAAQTGSGVDIHAIFHKMVYLHRMNCLHPSRDQNGVIKQIRTIAQFRHWVLECENKMLAHAVEMQRQKNYASMPQQSSMPQQPYMLHQSYMPHQQQYRG